MDMGQSLSSNCYIYSDRFTGVICLDGGPLDQRCHQAYRNLKEWVDQVFTRKSVSIAYEINAFLYQIHNARWKSVFKQIVMLHSGKFQWISNISAMHKEIKKDYEWDWSLEGNILVISRECSFFIWRVFSIGAYSANTLPFKYVFLGLNMGVIWQRMGMMRKKEVYEWVDHWLHECPKSDALYLANKIERWLKNNDGVHSLLTDRVEIGRINVPMR